MRCFDKKEAKGMKMSIKNWPLSSVFVASSLLFCGLAFVIPAEYCIKWESLDTFNFGEIESGKTELCTFTFRNCSSDSVTIANIRPACGCTTPDWRETPIPPDSTANIGIEFSSRKTGYFYKMIKVYFKEFPQAERIYVEGTVK